MNFRLLLASTLVCCCFVSISATSPQLTAEGAQVDDEDPLNQDLFRSQLSYGTILIALSAALSAGGGLGGGGLYLPIFVLALGYDPHTAIPLSKATIVGVAYGGYLFNYRRRHPLVDRPLIDYDLALLFQPMLLVGTIIGVTLNVFFPAVIITVLLTILLVVVAYRTLRKGVKLYREETKTIAVGGMPPQTNKAPSIIEVMPSGASREKRGLGDQKAIRSELDGSPQKYVKHKPYFKVGAPVSPNSQPSTPHSQPHSPRFAEEARESLVASSPACTEEQLLVLGDSLMHARQSTVSSTPRSINAAAESPISWTSESDMNSRFHLSVFDAAAVNRPSSKRVFTSVDEGSSMSSLSRAASSDDDSLVSGDGKRHRHVPAFDSDHNCHRDVSLPLPRRQGSDEIGDRNGKLARSEEIQRFLAEESSTSWLKFALAVFILIFVIVIALLKGGTSDQPNVIGVRCGTPEWWMLLLISLPVLAACTFGLARYTVRRARRKDEVGYPYVKGDIRWTGRTAITYPLFAAFAGTSAGCLGIGGGLVLGPLLLEIGVYPPVLSATSAFTIIFTSTSITAQFLILGRVPLMQGAWYCGVGFFSAIIGHLWVKALVKKYRKDSLVSLVLGAAVGLSAVVLIASQIMQVTSEPIDMSFHSLCAGSGH